MFLVQVQVGPQIEETRQKKARISETLKCALFLAFLKAARFRVQRQRAVKALRTFAALSAKDSCSTSR